MIWADKELASNHYQVTEEWARDVFNKAKNAYEKQNKKFEYSDHMNYTKTIQSWSINFLREGPVVAIVAQGPHAVELVRKIVGTTEPRQAIPGTIRGDYTIDSYKLADADGRAVRNIVHASGNEEEAEAEVLLWFKKEELINYRLIQEAVLYDVNLDGILE